MKRETMIWMTVKDDDGMPTAMSKCSACGFVIHMNCAGNVCPKCGRKSRGEESEFEQASLTIGWALEKTGLSMQQFGNLYGIPLRTIINWKRGKRQPPKYVLQLLVRAVEEDFSD